jgi:hypothetical protein
MNIRILTTTTLVLFTSVLIGHSQESAKKGKPIVETAMPIYITPYYNSEGLKIAVGEHSKKLAGADGKTILKICEELKKDLAKLPVEVIYVTAIRLYDLGHKDESVYWFYTAQFRHRVFISIIDQEQAGGIGDEGFELTQAYNSFFQLAGPYFNEYAFGDLKQLEKTLEKVIKEGKSLPKYGEIYPKVKFSPEKTWATQNADVSKGLSGLIDNIKKNSTSIKEKRKAEGLEDRNS